MYPHRIRLREPWQRETVAGGMWFRRFFNRPTISDGERVWVVCEQPKQNGVVHLDGVELGAIESDSSVWCADVTGRLKDRHELVFEMGATTDE
ncbi:MAG: hypothetical protein WAT39_06295, partial [Planctomycetota bacterium]